jgi:hypothetical protein
MGGMVSVFQYWVIDHIRQSERELPMSRVFEETSAILVLLVATVWRSVSENFPRTWP